MLNGKLDFRSDTITEPTDEMREAKTGWLQGRKVERSQDRSLAWQLSHNEYLGRAMAWYGDMEKKIESLSSEQILDAFKRHIQLDKFTFVRVGDFAAVKNKAPAVGVAPQK